MKVDGASPRGLWPPAGGGLCRRVVKGKVLKMDGPWTRLRREGSEDSKGSEGKVLRIDRPTAGGFLSLTAFQAEGSGLPFGQYL